jgi:threonine dehydrogenase-like Zn-dependent dehydrogenase
MSRLEEYRRPDPAGAPAVGRVWEVARAGVENLRPVERPLPSPGPDEALVRIDAVGICASDVKIINQGERHIRLRGRDLAADPVVLGHEVALTVVRPGERRAAAFPPGSRWTVNPDIYVGGVNTSYGFKIPGGYQQYQVLPAAVLDGWMLPLSGSVGYAQAALTEPWACVYFAYGNHRPHRGVARGGTAWYLGAGPVGLMHIEKGISDGAGRIVVSERNPARLERVRRVLGPRAGQRGIELILVDAATDDPTRHLPPSGADDILILAPVPELVTAALPHLARNGVMNVFAGFPDRAKSELPVNFYDLHYKNAVVISTSGAGGRSMEEALADSAAGKIDPNRAVGAIGGIDAIADGVGATAGARFPGRVLIYPQLRLPLTPVEELSPDGCWSREAEARLLEDRLGG